MVKNVVVGSPTMQKANSRRCGHESKLMALWAVVEESILCQSLCALSPKCDGWHGLRGVSASDSGAAKSFRLVTAVLISTVFISVVSG